MIARLPGTSRAAPMPFCATCILLPPVNHLAARDRELGPSLGADLEDAHASHIQQVAFPGMCDADEHIVARGTAYDRSHAMHVGGGRPNRIGSAATGAGDLGQRHFEWEDGLQDACGRVAIELVFHHVSPVGPKRSVLMRAVSALWQALPSVAISVSLVAFFFPWISMIVVAKRLPEARFVLLEQA